MNYTPLLTTLLLTLLLSPSLLLAENPPFTSYSDFVKSLPKCAQEVQPLVFAAAFADPPLGCGAAAQKSTNATIVACVCAASRTPLTAPLTSPTTGAPAFEEVATANCTKSTADIKMLLAQSELWIELCMGVQNGTWSGDLSQKQTPAAKASNATPAYVAASSISITIGLTLLAIVLAM